MLKKKKGCLFDSRFLIKKKKKMSDFSRSDCLDVGHNLQKLDVFAYKKNQDPGLSFK
jgi:hypothetical protein